MKIALHILAVLIFAGAGFFSFFLVFNRLILHMRQGYLKNVLSYLSMVVVFLGFTYSGISTGFSGWIWIPICLLIIYGIAEHTRHRKRKIMNYRIPDITLFDSRHHSTPQSTAHWNTTTDLRVRKYTIHMEDWKDIQLRIGHISDFHVDGRPELSFYRTAIKQMNQQQPDIVMLTGDYINRPDHIREFHELVSYISCPLGCYAILGNHDIWTAPDKIRSVLMDSGIHYLGGRRENISLPTGKTVSISGHEEPWGDSTSYPPPDPTSFNIALTHTPDNFLPLSRLGYQIIFAGHLHGGQWRFPILGSLVAPSHYGRLFDYGSFTANGSQMIVTAGLGNAWIPLRIRCCPEMVIVDINKCP